MFEIAVISICYMVSGTPLCDEYAPKQPFEKKQYETVKECHETAFKVAKVLADISGHAKGTDYHSKVVCVRRGRPA